MSLRITPFFFFTYLFTAAQALYAQCPITVNAGEDIYLCAPPTPVQLNGDIGGDYLNFFWSPTTGMSGANTLSPTVNVTTTTTYVLTGRAADLSNNLIVNGDFESGNSDFTSDYTYNPGDLVPEGVYDVLDNPQNSHTGFAPCNDHTSGSGNMMAVNGAGIPNSNVWCQTVSVTPNSQYVFSAWVTTLVASSPAQLQFSINGSPLGPIFSAPGGTCNWQDFFATWNSGSNSSATICIVNQNTALGGNDFALDDLVFAPTCLVTDTVKVHVISVNAVAAPAFQYIPCSGATITLNGTGSSVGANISYQWSTDNGNIVSGATTLMPVVDEPGEYTLTVQFEADGHICEKTATVNVALSPNQINAWITPPNPLGCGSSSTTLTANTNQAAFASYTWSTDDGNIVSGANQRICTVNQPGTYTVLVTNNSTGCTATAEVTVSVANNPPIANAGSSNNIDCINTSTQLSAAGSSTGGSIVYQWSTPDGNITNGQNSANASANAAGIYILAVTNNSNNCTTRDTITVTANNQAPLVNIAPPGILDCNTDTIPLNGVVSPAGSTVLWTSGPGGTITGGQTTLFATVTTSASYFLTATNPANGCTAADTVQVISDYLSPTALIQAPPQITCQSPSISLSGTGSTGGTGILYQWVAGPGGNIVSGGSGINPLVNTPGMYYLVVTNTVNACADTANTTVTADVNVVIAIAEAPDTLTCTQDTVRLVSSGSSSGPSIQYAWSTSDGQIAPGQSNLPSPEVLAPGTYTLVLSNTANGCTAQDIAIVFQDTLTPAITINSPNLLTCTAPSQTLQAINMTSAGQFSYQWSTNGGQIISGQSSLDPQIGAPGVYVLRSLNLQTGCISVDSVTVQQAADVPVASAAVSGILNCNASAIALNGSGSSSGPGYFYQWTATNGGHILSGPTTLNPMVDAPGDYALTVTNLSNGCTATAALTVQQDTISPALLAQAPLTLTCTTPEQFLQVQNLSQPALYQYQWTLAGAGNIVSGANTLTPLVSAGGLYQLYATNTDNGCTNTLLLSVPSDVATPALTMPAPVTLNCLQPTDTIRAQNQTGAGNFSYQWSAGAGGNIIADGNTLTPVVNSAGTYQISVTNLDNGCTAMEVFSVLIDTLPPVLQAPVPATITCNQPIIQIAGQNTGIPGTYIYEWSASNGGFISGNADQLTVSATSAGSYLLHAQNTNNGCRDSLIVQVLQNTLAPGVSAGLDDTLTCNITSLTLSGSASGSGMIDYLWQAGAGGQIDAGANSANPLVSGTGQYFLTVTDLANGCTASDEVSVLADVNAPTATVGASPVLTCSTPQAILPGSGSSGSQIAYAWSSANGHFVSGSNTLTPLVDAAGTYQLSVSNVGNGCVATATITVLEDAQPPAVDAGSTLTITCALPFQTLQGSAVSANGGAHTYSWQGPGIMADPNISSPLVNLPGQYQLTVTNILNGCTAVDDVSVDIDTISPQFSAVVTSVLTCVVTSVPVQGTVTQPTGNYTIAWQTLDGHIVSGQNNLTMIADKPGQYWLSIQNSDNGCADTIGINVQQDTLAPTALATAPTTLNCTITETTLSGAGSSNGPGFSYAWSAAGGNIISGNTTLAPLVDAPGLYTLTVTNQNNGCTKMAAVNLTENTEAPQIAIATPNVLNCQTQSILLQGIVSQPSGGFEAFWSTINGQLSGGANSLTPTATQPGLYQLLVTDLQNGCTATSGAQVLQDIVPPDADAGPDQALHCNQTSITLTGSSNTIGNLQYTWGAGTGNIVSGAGTPTPTVDAPGLYYVTVTNIGNGCTAGDTAIVTEIPAIDFSFTTTQPDCHTPGGVIQFEAVTGGQLPYLYSINDGVAFFTQNNFADLPPQTYTLVIEDANGCTETQSAQILQPVIPTITIPNILTIALGDTVQLQPQLNIPLNQVDTWSWTPTDSLSCSDCPSPFANPVTPGIYSLQIVDQNGCTASATVRIYLQKNRNIYAPNVIYPAGQGANQYFTLFGKGVREIHFLQIFDRWGNQLFEQRNFPFNVAELGWNGLYNGDQVNPGVYVWQARVEFLDGETAVLSGDVTVMR